MRALFSSGRRWLNTLSFLMTFPSAACNVELRLFLVGWVYWRWCLGGGLLCYRENLALSSYMMPSKIFVSDLENQCTSYYFDIGYFSFLE